MGNNKEEEKQVEEEEEEEEEQQQQQQKQHQKEKTQEQQQEEKEVKPFENAKLFLLLIYWTFPTFLNSGFCSPQPSIISRIS